MIGPGSAAAFARVDRQPIAEIWKMVMMMLSKNRAACRSLRFLCQPNCNPLRFERLDMSTEKESARWR